MNQIEEDYVAIKSKASGCWMWIQLIVCIVFTLAGLIFLWGFYTVVTE